MSLYCEYSKLHTGAPLTLRYITQIMLGAQLQAKHGTLAPSSHEQLPGARAPRGRQTVWEIYSLQIPFPHSTKKIAIFLRTQSLNETGQVYRSYG